MTKGNIRKFLSLLTINLGIIFFINLLNDMLSGFNFYLSGHGLLIAFPSLVLQWPFAFLLLTVTGFFQEIGSPVPFGFYPGIYLLAGALLVFFSHSLRRFSKKYFVLCMVLSNVFLSLIEGLGLGLAMGSYYWKAHLIDWIVSNVVILIFAYPILNVQIKGAGLDEQISSY